MEDPTIKFLSLFVKDLNESRTIYANIFGTPEDIIDDNSDIIRQHPFSGPLPPAIFNLGSLKMVLYQADGKTTHPGDLGIGLLLSEGLAEGFLHKVIKNNGKVFFGPRQLLEQNRKLAIFVLPGQHFFELLT